MKTQPREYLVIATLLLVLGCTTPNRQGGQAPEQPDAESAQPKLAKDAAKFISAAYIAEAKAKELGLTGSELLSWRQQHCRPHFDNFKKWALATAPTLLPDDPLRNLSASRRDVAPDQRRMVATSVTVPRPTSSVL